MRTQRLMLKLRAILNNAWSGIGRSELAQNGFAARYEKRAGAPPDHSWRRDGSRCLALLRTTRARVILFWTFIAIIVVTFFNPLTPTGSPPEVDPSIPRHFRLLIPASGPDTNLCKTLVSSAISGFPPPVILNWKKTYNKSFQIFGGSHLGKVDGVLKHLNSLDRQYDHDLVLLVDGYDVWFQLRPSVLIERFLDIQKKGNERLRKQYGGSLMARENINQRVIFSAQKKCWPKEEDHPACWLIPESTLPANTYGSGTDRIVDDPANPFAKYRQKYLNSGSVIGTVADVRSVFQRASEIAKDDPNLGSDQGIFAQIFAEQEFRRYETAKDSRNIFRMLLDIIRKNTGRSYTYQPIDPDNKGNHEFVKLSPEKNYEFGIGLDYKSRLLHGTVFSEDDSAWVVHQDKEAVARAWREMKIPGSPKIEPLPKEVRQSRAPFHDLGDSQQSSDGAWNAWEQVPLFTNMWTGVSPVAVHHNAHHDNLKRRLKLQWNETWFFPFARHLLERRLLDTSQRPIAITRETGPEQHWLFPSSRKDADDWNSFSTDRGQKLTFKEICSNSWAELFADGEHSWEDPRNNPKESGSHVLEAVNQGFGSNSEEMS